MGRQPGGLSGTVGHHSQPGGFSAHHVSGAAEPLPANNTAPVGFNRTRRKYKINREQNRDQSMAVAGAVASMAGGARKRQQVNQTRNNQEALSSSAR